MNDRYQILRELGARAHQLRAATRAADHFIATQQIEDRDTGSWLMSCAVGLADDVAHELDEMARGLRDAPADPALVKDVQKLRVRAHQLHAASRAADHFLDRDNPEDHDTGLWLIACARGVADKLADEVDDCASGLKRIGSDNVMDANDAAFVRRVAHAVRPARDAA